jgi:protein SCO1/2
MKRTAGRVLLAVLLLLLVGPLTARIDTRAVGWDQHPGAHLPLQLRFRDETNRVVALGDYFGRTPVVLVMMYFSCPELCPMVLHGVQESLQNTGLAAGRDYALLTVSIDPRDTPSRAAQESAQMLRDSPVRRAAHFLTAADGSASALAGTLGFRYVYDPEHGQFAHAAGFVILNPRGEISRYFFGVRYPTGPVRTALIDAGHGRVAAFADQFLLLCYHFDPTLGRYSLAIVNVLRVMGILAVLLGVLAWWHLSYSKPRSHQDPIDPGGQSP